MKKKRIWIVILVIILLVLIFPITSVYSDGGTKTFTSLTYKVIIWDSIFKPEDEKPEVDLYLFPNNFHSIDYYR